MKISIILPSRERPKYLLESFESFISKAKNNKDIQYIGVIDDDDMETKEYKDTIVKMGKKYDVDIELYETPRIPFEQYLNTGATVATGDVLFFIADDVFCDKKINKCLIGNKKKSFYSDYHHLTSDGANMIENKIIKVIKSF